MATAKKRSTKKAPQMESFKVSKNPSPFMTMKITKQTVYWTILLGLILGLGIWVLNIQIDTIRALDVINAI
ncbi:MAG: hypothetical protein WCP11_01515 [Candidatus Saccharibacteria bacterium]